MANIRPLKSWTIDLDKADQELPDVNAFYYPHTQEERNIYLCGHSLGLQPVNSSAYLQEISDQWRLLGVEGHFAAKNPWIDYLNEPVKMMADIVNAMPHEVVIMNSLTVNIHLLLSGFYEPRGKRTKIVIDFPTFPSDIYAIRSHLAVRGYHPDQIWYWQPDEQTGLFETEDLAHIIQLHHEEIDLVFVSGVHYLNGQFLDLEAISNLIHEYPIKFGVDLAHAAGNVELFLHRWQVDFACWCTYKYLNSGPGSLGACFIHEKHHHKHRHFQGWWGNSMDNRFEMQPDFTPAEGAWSWQLSNPPVISLPPLKASLEIYDRFGMAKIRSKGKMLSSFLYDALEKIAGDQFQIMTPADPERRGAMLCLQFNKEGSKVFQSLREHNIIVDYRKPDTIRVAAHPLYNNFADCHYFVNVLKKAMM